MGFDDRLDGALLEIIQTILLHAQDDPGAVLKIGVVRFALGNRERPGRVRLPTLDALRVLVLGVHLHMIGHEVRRVKPHTKLTDQTGFVVSALLGVLLYRLHKLLRPRIGDRTETTHEVVFGHADAVVLDRQLLGLVVARDANDVVSQFRVPIFGLVDGVRTVADELSQKDVLVRIEGVDDQRKQLVDLGLKSECFRHVYLL